MDKLQCMVPVTGFDQSNGFFQVLWFRTLVKLKESVPLKKGNELPAVITLGSHPGWAYSCPSPAGALLHALFGTMRLALWCLPWKPSCAEAIQMCSWCVKLGRGRRALSTQICVWICLPENHIKCLHRAIWTVWYHPIYRYLWNGMWWGMVSCCEEWQWGCQDYVSLYGKRWKAKYVESSLQ